MKKTLVRIGLVVALSVPWLAVTASQGSNTQTAQQPSTPPSKPSTAPPKPTLDIAESLRLTGCIQTDPTSKQLKLTDSKKGVTYFLSGKDVAVYNGRKVSIVGGLMPTPNVAAQAGAVDQTHAVNERLGASRGTGDIRTESLFVTSVSPLKGSCRP